MITETTRICVAEDADCTRLAEVLSRLTAKDEDFLLEDEICVI